MILFVRGERGGDLDAVCSTSASRGEEDADKAIRENEAQWSSSEAQGRPEEATSKAAHEVSLDPSVGVPPAFFPGFPLRWHRTWHEKRARGQGTELHGGPEPTPVPVYQRERPGYRRLFRGPAPCWGVDVAASTKISRRSAARPDTFLGVG